MIRNISFFCLTAALFVSPSLLANRMVTDTRNVLNSIRSAVIKKEKEDKTALQWAPEALRKMAMKVKGLSDHAISSADVAIPFFLVKNADQCLDNIGSTAEDIAYLQSVFSEFYGSGQRTEYRLITILHSHMMAELGFSMTLKEFKKTLKKTNKKNFPVALSDRQFNAYCRCVARGLYAVYWFEHGQK